MNSFRHLKLEIALAIPASNEWKIETNNLYDSILGQRLVFAGPSGR